MDEQERNKQFEVLYDTHARSLIRFVFIKTSDNEIAQDIVSEAFLRYWKHFVQGERITNPKAFLFLIARGLIIDHYRRETKRNHVSLEGVDESLLAGNDIVTGDIVQDIDTRQLIAKTLTALELIGEGYKEILLLRYVEDLNTHEISEVLGKNQLAVRVSLHRATRALKKHMNSL